MWSIPWDTGVVEKNRENLEKYHDLKMEIGRLCQAEVEMLPIILGAIGLISDDLKRNVGKIGRAKLQLDLHQISVLLATARIVRGAMYSFSLARLRLN